VRAPAGEPGRLHQIRSPGRPQAASPSSRLPAHEIKKTMEIEMTTACRLICRFASLVCHARRRGRGWEDGRVRTRGRTGGAAASSARPWWPAKLSPASPASLDRLPERGVAPRPHPSRRRDHQGSGVAPAMVVPMEKEPPSRGGTIGFFSLDGGNLCNIPGYQLNRKRNGAHSN
jgi:hypothetical protein